MNEYDSPLNLAAYNNCTGEPIGLSKSRVSNSLSVFPAAFFKLFHQLRLSSGPRLPVFAGGVSTLRDLDRLLSVNVGLSASGLSDRLWTVFFNASPTSEIFLQTGLITATLCNIKAFAVRHFLHCRAERAEDLRGFLLL